MARTFRHVLITGAAGAIGGALTAQLADRYPAARFTLVDRDEAALSRRAASLGERATAAVWDLTRIDALETHWRAAARPQAIDLLVNCAGVMEIKTLQGTPWDEGEALLRVNLLAPLRLMQLAVEGMLAAGGGAVVNLSSMAGRTPIRGCSYYGGAKAGLAMASEIARLDLADRGVDVLTVYPGPIFSGLERHARGQVEPGLISKVIPTGAPEAIARRIVAALEAGEPRVVYPDVYKLGYAFHGVAGWVTSTFSPRPLD